jgi:hypothetical protein
VQVEFFDKLKVPLYSIVQVKFFDKLKVPLYSIVPLNSVFVLTQWFCIFGTLT